MDPLRMLEQFESKHGGFYELLGEYPSRDERRNEELRRLMNTHNRLVSLWVGYMAGVKDAERKAAGETR
jgi:hypothetical protein